VTTSRAHSQDGCESGLVVSNVWLTAVTMRVIGMLAAMVAAGALWAASADGATWTTQTTSGATGLAESALTSVSCVSATSCMAVGVDDNGAVSVGGALVNVGSFAESWNGSAWTVVPTAGSAGANPGLYGVSCVSVVFCVAVGETHSGGRTGLRFNDFAAGPSRALVEVWNGLAWAVQPNAGAAVSGSGLFGVSCTSSRFCVAVGGHGAYVLTEVWNGSTWRLQSTPTVAKYGEVLAGISCVAANWCTAVGSYNTDKRLEQAAYVPLAERWNGRRWSVQRPPPELVRYHGRRYANFTQLTSASCTSHSFCLASGFALRAQNGDAFGAFAVRWDGARWVTANAGRPYHSPFYSVACLSSTYCVAVGQFDNSVFPAPSTTQPLAEGWDGQRWGRIALPHVAIPSGATRGVPDALDPALIGVSCVSRTGCAAVGAEAQGSDSAILAQSDMGTPGAAPRVPLTQTSPRSATVADRAGYHGQLAVANALGAVTYNETASADAADAVVSSAGAITVATTIAPGVYIVSGTDSDAAGDTGAWGFTLTVNGASGLPPLGTPVFGHTATVRPVSGVVLVKEPGSSKFVSLRSGSTVPLGAVVDTTRGRVRLTAATGAHTKTQTGLFYSGVFRVTQTRARSAVRGGRIVGLTLLTLAGPRPSGCSTAPADGSTPAVLARRRRRTRRLWGNGHGNFRTVGTDASATVRGTEWLTQDSCAGTLIHVTRGVVSVDDFPHHRTFLLRAPHSFIAHRGLGG
jgi:hypothetical protein